MEETYKDNVEILWNLTQPDYKLHSHMAHIFLDHSLLQCEPLLAILASDLTKTTVKLI